MYLLGFVPVWVSQWLTPMWILGVGALVGLLALLALWGVAAALSRIPALGTLEQRPAARRNVVVILAGLLFLLGMSFAGWSAWATEDRAAPLLQLLTSLLILLAPVLAGAIIAARALVALVSQRTVAEVPTAIREGALWPVMIVAGSLAAFGVIGTVVVEQPMEMLTTVARLPLADEQTLEFEIPPSGEELEEHVISVQLDRTRLEQLTLQSDTPLAVKTRPAQELLGGPAFDVPADEPVVWTKGTEENPFDDELVDELYVVNRSSSPATLQMTIVNSSEFPQMAVVFIAALCLASVILLYVVQRAVMPKLSAVAHSTFKSEIAQPLFPIILVGGAVLLAIFIVVPYNTFGEDIKMLKSSGLTLIMVLGIIQAIWAASTSVADEIEGRTALTVLSKPVTRLSFIVGKYVGIIWTVAVVYIVLGVILLVAVGYKPIYDVREGTDITLSWQLCFFEVMGTVPGLVLGFMETIVLAALSVAISTRLPMLANFSICFSIYVLGHLTPAIVQSSMAGFPIVKFVGQLIATVFPILDYFSTDAAVAAGTSVPPVYLGWSLLYCMIYSLIAMLLALVLFEDRDLA